ncbi:MAG TPA: hypothetical protein VKI17_11640 [Gemmataceae bacterium]|nr:hypothetical protein [Gemmataceae bacterium]
MFEKLKDAATFAWDLFNANLFLGIVLGGLGTLLWLALGCP